MITDLGGVANRARVWRVAVGWKHRTLDLLPLCDSNDWEGCCNSNDCKKQSKIQEKCFYVSSLSSDPPGEEPSRALALRHTLGR